MVAHTSARVVANATPAKKTTRGKKPKVEIEEEIVEEIETPIEIKHKPLPDTTNDVLEKLEENIIKKAEAGMARMEKRFEVKCVQIAHKIELDRRKLMDADLQRYKKEMEDIMYDYVGRLQKVADDTAASQSKNNHHKPDETEIVVPRLRNRKVAHPKANIHVEPIIIDEDSEQVKDSDEEEDAWGDDISAEPTPRKEEEEGSLHAILHEFIILMQDKAAATHDALDAEWVSLAKFHIDGPTRTDIEDVTDRQAEMVRIAGVLHTKVAAEASRLHVSPNVLYSGDAVF
jgi:hypothetical protein